VDYIFVADGVGLPSTTFMYGKFGSKQNGHYAIHSHSKSLILVPIESRYEISYNDYFYHFKVIAVLNGGTSFCNTCSG